MGVPRTECPISQAVVKLRLAFFTTRSSIMWSRKLNLKAQKFYRFQSQIMPSFRFLFNCGGGGGGDCGRWWWRWGSHFSGYEYLKPFARESPSREKVCSGWNDAMCATSPNRNAMRSINEHFTRFGPGPGVSVVVVVVVIIFFWRNQRQHLLVSEVSIQRRDVVCRFWSKTCFRNLFLKCDPCFARFLSR